MEVIIKNIKSFKNRLKFISQNINLIVDNLSETNELSHEDQYAIVEPLITALIKSSEAEADGREAEVDDRSEKYAEMVEQLHVRKNKIMAIKIFRDLFKWGLKESKEEIERVYNGTNFTVDRWEVEGNLIWKR